MDSKSIFQLETSPQGLMDSGVEKFHWAQYPSTRDTSGDNFSNGVQRWRWQGASNEWFLPSQSYLRYRIKITRGAAAGNVAPELKDNIAPAMNTCSQFYQSMNMKMGGTTVSRINDYVAQYDTLKKRMNLSKSLLDSTCDTKGNFEPGFKCRQSKLAADAIRLDKLLDANPLPAQKVAFDFSANNDTVAYDIINDVPTITMTGGSDWSALFAVGDKIELAGGVSPDNLFNTARVVGVTALVLQLDSPLAGQVAFAQVAVGAAPRVIAFNKIIENHRVGANIARANNEIELLWKPPLSFFDYEGALPMCCKYELELVPHTRDSLKRRIIQSVFADKAPGVDFDVDIEQVYLYLAEVKGPAVDDATFYLDMKECNIQTEKIDNSGALAQKNFDVSPSTKALTVFYQDERANAGTQVSDSLFKVYNTDITNSGRRDVSEELKLTRWYLQYAGTKYPQVDFDPSFTEGKDRFTQLWLESACATGGKYDTGGHETIDDWIERGPYLHIKTPKGSTDRSTRVSVHNAFSGGVDTTHMRVMLASHYSIVFEVQLQDGRIKQVRQFEI